jgi:hypothetical protein
MPERFNELLAFDNCDLQEINFESIHFEIKVSRCKETIARSKHAII